MFGTVLYYLVQTTIVVGGVYAFYLWVRWDWRQEAERLSTEQESLAKYARSEAIDEHLRLGFELDGKSWSLGRGRVRLTKTQNDLGWCAWTTAAGIIIVAVSNHELDMQLSSFATVNNRRDLKLTLLNCGPTNEWLDGPASRNDKNRLLDAVLAALESSFPPLARWKVMDYSP